MKVTPSGKRPFPTPPTPNAQDLESGTFANRDTVALPDEIVKKILMNLGTTDIAVCRSVSRQWQTVIDTRHLLARSFYRDCHLTQRINSPAAQRNLAVERYHSHIRGWLTDFGNRGRETAEQLDNILGDVHFPEVLFFSIPKLLLNSNELTYQNTATIQHLGVVRSVGVVNDASFSPDGKYLVTVSTDNAAKLSELEGGQWREKVTLRHSAWLKSASFSPDGKLLVTASSDRICKIWRLEDDQWQEKATIEHSDIYLGDVHLSPDGKHLVTVPDRKNTVKIWWHVDDQWQEKATIAHSEREMTNAQFSPDGKHLVSTSVDGSVKIWKLDDGQWEEKFIIHQRFGVANARFSPDGKHLVMSTCGVTTDGPIYYAKLWEFVDHQSQEKVSTQQWQEKATIQHSGMVNNVHFGSDGKHLVTASRDGTVKICGLVDGKWQRKVTIWHDEAVTNASFGPDDYQLVTTCRDNTAKIWVLKNKENDDNS